MEIHIVTTQSPGFAREDPSTSKALVALTDRIVAEKVATLWGNSHVDTIVVDAIPAGILSKAKEFRISLEIEPASEQSPSK